MINFKQKLLSFYIKKIFFISFIVFSSYLYCGIMMSNYLADAETLCCAQNNDKDYTVPGATPDTESLPAAETPVKNRDSKSNVVGAAGWNIALQEEAEKRGISLGWRHEAANINKTLKFNAAYLDRIFDFKPFMLSEHILAPAIGASSDDFTVESYVTARSFVKQFRFVTPVQTVSAPPDWRTYLLLTMYPEHKVNKAMLPKTSLEEKLWKKAIKQGWEQGKELADQEELLNLRILKREIIGRIRYYRMLKDHMIVPPSWTIMNLGITSDKDNQIVTIGSKLLQVTGQSRFMVPKYWKPESYIKTQNRKEAR